MIESESCEGRRSDLQSTNHSFTRRISCLIFRLLNKDCCRGHLSERRRAMYHERHYYIRRGKYDVCISLKMRVLLYMSKSHHPWGDPPPPLCADQLSARWTGIDTFPLSIRSISSSAASSRSRRDMSNCGLRKLFVGRGGIRGEI